MKPSTSYWIMWMFVLIIYVVIKDPNVFITALFPLGLFYVIKSLESIEKK